MPVPSGFTVPDGRDFADLFVAGSSSHVTNYIGIDGLDIGDSFQGGKGSVSTNYYTPSGTDVGRLFRPVGDQEQVILWAHVHNDHLTRYSLDFRTGVNTCYAVSHHGWGGYWEYDVQVYQSSVSYAYNRMRYYGATPTFTIKTGYDSSLSGGLSVSQVETPSSSNDWCFKYDITEGASGEHDFYFEISMELF